MCGEGVLPKWYFSRRSLVASKIPHNSDYSLTVINELVLAKTNSTPAINIRSEAIWPTALETKPMPDASATAAAALAGWLSWFRSSTRKFCTTAINQLWIRCRANPRHLALLAPWLLKASAKLPSMTCCRRLRLYRPAGLLASARAAANSGVCTCR